ncbi:MAG: MBL fold metallo-hydrolase [Deltaproteobacteria bacterium]|jgi:L-ascorbate metabolism protein UlaG (beta-lactamase superfamily)|nr:MBL fold metallo-hydrolase [Deltaproteobacteria bacterium]
MAGRENDGEGDRLGAAEATGAREAADTASSASAAADTASSIEILTDSTFSSESEVGVSSVTETSGVTASLPDAAEAERSDEGLGNSPGGKGAALSASTPREKGFARLMFWVSLLGLALPLAALALAATVFLSLPRFGALPSGERMRRAEGSPLYRDGVFLNEIPTSRSAEGTGVLEMLSRALDPAPRKVPAVPLPTRKSDLKSLPEGSLVWLGHSSFVLRLAGATVAADPVLGRYASPVKYVNGAFPGTEIYSAEDFPEIDILLISHDHFDHLDQAAAVALRERTRAVVCGLGTGAHLERWGWDPERIREGLWWDSFRIGGLEVALVPARHGSNRGVRMDRALWTGFAVSGGGRKIFYSGDSGYGPHFMEAGDRLGPFDLGLLDAGQYDFAWPEIHMTPEEALTAALDLRLRRYMPVHLGKFAIAVHPWDEPLERAFDGAARTSAFRLVTPLIGETVLLDDEQALYRPWWRGIP